MSVDMKRTAGLCWCTTGLLQIQSQKIYISVYVDHECYELLSTRATWIIRSCSVKLNLVLKRKNYWPLSKTPVNRALIQNGKISTSQNSVEAPSPPAFWVCFFFLEVGECVCRSRAKRAGDGKICCPLSGSTPSKVMFGLTRSTQVSSERTNTSLLSRKNVTNATLMYFSKLKENFYNGLSN